MEELRRDVFVSLHFWLIVAQVPAKSFKEGSAYVKKTKSQVSYLPMPCQPPRQPPAPSKSSTRTAAHCFVRRRFPFCRCSANLVKFSASVATVWSPCWTPMSVASLRNPFASKYCKPCFGKHLLKASSDSRSLLRNCLVLVPRACLFMVSGSSELLLRHRASTSACNSHSGMDWYCEDSSSDISHQ